jgi:hypothetical protein
VHAGSHKEKSFVLNRRGLCPASGLGHFPQGAGGFAR